MSIKKVMGGYVLGLKYSPNGLERLNVPKEGPVVLYCNHINKADHKLVSYFLRRSLYYVNGVVDKVECYNALADNKALVIFEEGRPNPSVSNNFSYEAIEIGVKSDATVIPVAITGEYEKDGDLTVTYGDPVHISDMDVIEAKAFIEEKIKELMLGRKTNE